MRKYLASNGLDWPTTCQKCGHVPDHAKYIRPLVETGNPADAIWVCISCYRVARPSKATPRKPEYVVKAPSYERMKGDVQRGMSYPEMAAAYGMNKGTVFATLKRRAQRRGEWPIKTEIQVNVIWDLVRAHMAEEHKQHPVWVSQLKAREWAPRCTVASRREWWPNYDPPRYHVRSCKLLGHIMTAAPTVDDPHPGVFSISVDEADAWGYEACIVCTVGSMQDWAEEHGFDPNVLRRMEQGKRKKVPLSLARRLLEAIGEPVPYSLLPVDEIPSRRR